MGQNIITQMGGAIGATPPAQPPKTKYFGTLSNQESGNNPTAFPTLPNG
jgi:hypothetical protein